MNYTKLLGRWEVHRSASIWTHSTDVWINFKCIQDSKTIQLLIFLFQWKIGWFRITIWGLRITLRTIYPYLTNWMITWDELFRSVFGTFDIDGLFRNYWWRASVLILFFVFKRAQMLIPFPLDCILEWLFKDDWLFISWGFPLSIQSLLWVFIFNISYYVDVSR